MTEKSMLNELRKDPFTPMRLHLVSGKTIDILRPDAAWTLSYALLVLRNPKPTGPSAEGYDTIAYHNIERIEQLELGKRAISKRKPA